MAITHGKSHINTYRIWAGMKCRCACPTTPDFRNYGARGIKVCDRWLKFENFLADMGERPLNKTIDRLDNDGNYEPGNCRWATALEQANNKRKGNIGKNSPGRPPGIPIATITRIRSMIPIGVPVHRIARLTGISATTVARIRDGYTRKGDDPNSYWYKNRISASR